MDRVRRSLILSPMALGVLGASNLWAQGLSEEQRKDFARQYGVETYDSLDRALRDLHALQEGRMAAPAQIDAYRHFLESHPLLKALRLGVSPELYHLMAWHEFSLILNAHDHTTIDPVNPPPTYGEQFGPCRSSRALAIVHLAMFEAINCIYQRYSSYENLQEKILMRSGLRPQDVSESNTSVRHAIAYAAYGTLLKLYPKKSAHIELDLVTILPLLNASPLATSQGTRIGQQAARAILEHRKYDEQSGAFGDGSHESEPNASDIASEADPNFWQIDPISQLKTALGGKWDRVDPFVKWTNRDQFLPGPPPPFDEDEFRMARDDVRMLGGDDTVDNVPPRWRSPHTRSEDQTFAGIFWGYDGTALLCAPPRLYNMIATSIATQEKPVDHVCDMARLLALVNIAMADTGIAAWQAKYRYLHPRPVTYIRQIEPDKVEHGIPNRDWTPLGAPVTNGRREERNLTPPFPAYPSGHAAFGGALFGILRKFWTVDDQDTGTGFMFVSDEYNGVNREPGQEARPLRPRPFVSFKEAEEENGQSRVYLGIHWKHDKTAGIAQGNAVADYVYGAILQRVS